MPVRKGKFEDIDTLQKLFVDTIRQVCTEDYTPEQIKVWVQSVDNRKRWEEMLKSQYVLVSEDANIINGFCTLRNGNYIDLLYVHKDYQRMGIAHTLYKSIELEAKRQGHGEIISHVSKTAKPFFEKAGFRNIEEQRVVLKGVELINYRMKKKIG